MASAKSAKAWYVLGASLVAILTSSTTLAAIHGSGVKAIHGSGTEAIHGDSL